jgi:hypothetical protein
MTRPLPFTQASLKRAIEAARKAGLRVMGIRPDGTILVDNGGGLLDQWQDWPPTDAPSKWEDVET